FLSRCTADDCTTADAIALSGNPVTFDTTWSIGTSLVLKLLWDAANGKFKFQVVEPSTAIVLEAKNIVYSPTVTNVGPPTSFDFKSVRLQNFVENCTAARQRTMMDVNFDNVKLKRVP